MFAFIVVLCQYLALVGALAWGVVGWTGVDPVRALFGGFADVVKMSIGIAAVVLLVLRFT